MRYSGFVPHPAGRSQRRVSRCRFRCCWTYFRQNGKPNAPDRSGSYRSRYPSRRPRGSQSRSRSDPDDACPRARWGHAGECNIVPQCRSSGHCSNPSVSARQHRGSRKWAQIPTSALPGRQVLIDGNQQIIWIPQLDPALSPRQYLRTTEWPHATKFHHPSINGICLELQVNLVVLQRTPECLVVTTIQGSHFIKLKCHSLLFINGEHTPAALVLRPRLQHREAKHLCIKRTRTLD